MNAGGIVLIALGVFLAVVGFRGTQGQIFPWFFGPEKTTKEKIVQGKSPVCPNGKISGQGGNC